MSDLLRVQSFEVGDAAEELDYPLRPQPPDVLLQEPGGEIMRVSPEYENIITIFLSAGFRRVVHEEQEQPG